MTSKLYIFGTKKAKHDVTNKLKNNYIKQAYCPFFDTDNNINILTKPPFKYSLLRHIPIHNPLRKANYDSSLTFPACCVVKYININVIFKQ